MTAKQTLVSALSKIGLIIAVAAAFLMAMLGTIYLSLRSPEVRVPEVVNQKRWDAEDALNESGLNMRVRATRYVAKVQPDMVLTQSPAPGEAVKAGQTIAVVVSRAPGKDDQVVTTSEVTEGEQTEGTQNQNAAAQNQNSNARPVRPRNVNSNARNTNSAAGAGNANGNRNANRNAIINRNSNVGGANVTNSNRAPRANVNVNRRPATTAPTPPAVPRPNN